MSITVKLFSDEDLTAIAQGMDDFDATLLANKKTYSANEMKVLVKIHSTLKTYQVFFKDGEGVNVKAPNQYCLKWFLEHEYNTGYIEAIDEIQTKYIPVDISDLIK